VNTNLYIITPIFNPFDFQSRIRLYRNFARHMEDSGARLFTIEAAFGDRAFQVTTADNPMNCQVRTNQILWHKERMINLAVARLLHVVPDARFLGWYDADVTFANPDWAAEVTHKLTHLSVIQPFATAINLDSSDGYMWNCPSSMRSFIQGRGFHQDPPLPVSYTYKGHPGLAWNLTREAFDGLGGLYDGCIAGSADTIMSNAFKGDWSVYLPARQSQPMMDSMAAWQEKANKYVRGRLGFTRGCLLHHWHGASGDRGYEQRWSITSFHRYDPNVDIVLDSNGLYKWAGNKPRLEDDIRLSLGARNEDAV
jgi:hypothetical protein